MNMFEIATREKIRFNYKGQISVEELWDLNLQSLDVIYSNIATELQELNQHSLLNKTQSTKQIELQRDIVKYIFDVKQLEQQERVNAKEKKQQREKLKEILAQKKDENLKNLTEEEIEAKIKELQ